MENIHTNTQGMSMNTTVIPEMIDTIISKLESVKNRKFTVEDVITTYNDLVKVNNVVNILLLNSPPEVGGGIK
jgi:hypothetical protein